jgi:hypothetical protein
MKKAINLPNDKSLLKTLNSKRKLLLKPKFMKTYGRYPLKYYYPIYDNANRLEFLLH